MEHTEEQLQSSMQRLTDRLQACVKGTPLMAEYLKAILTSFYQTEEARQILEAALRAIAEGDPPPPPLTEKTAAAMTVMIARMIDREGSKGLDEICRKNVSMQ